MKKAFVELLNHRFFPVGAVVILIVTAMIPFHINPDNFLADDAYFYPQIAWNIVQGHGSTFHAITQTNGYHPLWMVVCVLASALARNKIHLLHILGIIQAVFVGISSYYLYRITNQLKLNMKFFFIGLVLLIFFLLQIGGLRLFEAHLSILLQLIAFDRLLMLRDNFDLWKFRGALNKKNIDLDKPEEFRNISNFTAYQMIKDHIILGILLGLILLSRLDTIFLVAVFYLFVCLVNRPFSLMSWYALSVPIFIIFGGYLGYNYYIFGHLVPISGAIKSSFPKVDFSFQHLGLHGLKIVPFVIGLSLICLTFEVKKKGKGFDLFLVSSLGMIFHSIYIIAFSWGSQWYYTTEITILPVALIFVCSKADLLIKAFAGQNRQFNRLFINLVAITIFLIGLLISSMKISHNFSIGLFLTGEQRISAKVKINPGKVVALALKKQLEPGSKVFVYDSPGIIAFYSDLSILPFDGLVNDYQYLQEIVSFGINEYIRKHNVHYFLGPFLESYQSYQMNDFHAFRNQEVQYVKMNAPLSHEYAGSITLLDSDILLKLKNPVRPAEKNFPFVALWKIR